MIKDYNALSGLIIGGITFSLFCYAAILQAEETCRPKDRLTKLRWEILIAISITILGSVPSLVLLYSRTLGIAESSLAGLRDVATIAGRISGLATGILVIGMMLNYRKN